MVTTTLIILAVAGALDVIGEDHTPDAGRIERLGLTARIDPSLRDRAIQQIAIRLKEMADADKSRAQQMQSAFQEALLLVCDRDVIGTLSNETIEAVDDAIESTMSLDDLARGGWDRLGYVYGFFNHDVTVKEIKRVADGWDAIPEDQREPHYPQYVHLIDAVCKPLSIDGLQSDQETSAALAIALPLLKSMLLQKPKPGRAFHPPSHAALILGPLYERWERSEKHRLQLLEYLGDRQEFVALMLGQLVGARNDRMDLTDRDYAFYAYTGRYLANALARLNARAALPALQHSLDVYQAKGVAASTTDYTRRSLIALGDESERTQLEQGTPDHVISIAVWLARNGQGETAAYGRRLLGDVLRCDPGEAIERHFRGRLATLGG